MYNSNSSSLAWAISYDSTYFIDGENEDPGKGYDLSRMQGESGLQAGPAAGILDRSPRLGDMSPVDSGQTLQVKCRLQPWCEFCGLCSQ